MEPLVSIITPCYNGEGKINIFLDSVLNQTYSNIEFIIINDGSTDNTEKIILNYKVLFEKKGYTFIYLKQANSGQDVALNNGLKYFSGKYLMWSDSDDILDKNNIREKVNYFEKHVDCSLVYCNAFIVREENLNKPIKYWNKKLNIDKKDFFKDVIEANDIIYAGGAWMLRSKSFLSIRPNRNIEIEGFGQNWQMLLPMIYNFSVGKIDKYLFTYIIYKNSHSHKKKTYMDEYLYVKKVKKGLLNILNNININIEDREKLYNLIDNMINYRLMKLSMDNEDRNKFKIKYTYLKSKHFNFKIKDKMKIILFRTYIYKYMKKIKDILK